MTTGKPCIMIKSMNASESILAYISLGSNLGDPAGNLRVAVEALGRLPGLLAGKLSPVYLTEPQGHKDQPWFANQVMELICPAAQDPRLLLQTLLALEIDLGRERAPDTPPNSPRVIDLDLLLLGGLTHASRDLILPHPRLLERAFVLVPLLDIAPELILPGGRPAEEALRKLDCRVQDNVIYQG